MKKLTNEQIIEICDKVIEKVKEADKNNEWIYLCIETKLIICKILNKEYCEIITSDYITEFTNENAVKYANGRRDSSWWKSYTYSNRIKFMEWIKSQYQNK